MRSVTRNGVMLAFDDRGVGDPALVFVHGWCCDHTQFQPQMAYFADDHRVLALDLRGHGASDKPVQRYHPDDFADDINWLVTELGLERPVIVGHSMGGLIGLRMAYLYPHALSGLVALDSAWVMTPTFAQRGPVIAEALRGSDYQVALAESMAGSFLPRDDPHRRQQILDLMCSTRQDIMISEWVESIENTDSLQAIHGLTVPTLYVASEMEYVELDVIRSAANVTVGQTIGSGHFHQLECPDQVNAMIARFLYVHGLHSDHRTNDLHSIRKVAR
jgi:pimeloyl-ACP methyl ester carboxylesterase